MGWARVEEWEPSWAALDVGCTLEQALEQVAKVEEWDVAPEGEGAME
jgi:hypothetical protein